MPIPASIVIPIRPRTERDLANAIRASAAFERSLVIEAYYLGCFCSLLAIVLIRNSPLPFHAGPFNCSHFAS